MKGVSLQHGTALKLWPSAHSQGRPPGSGHAALAAPRSAANSAIIGREMTKKIARALISTMARSMTRSNQRPDTLMQDRLPLSRQSLLAPRIDRVSLDTERSGRRRTRWSYACENVSSGSARRNRDSKKSGKICTPCGRRSWRPHRSERPQIVPISERTSGALHAGAFSKTIINGRSAGVSFRLAQPTRTQLIIALGSSNQLSLAR